jgi:hypothetical protein
LLAGKILEDYQEEQEAYGSTYRAVRMFKFDLM